MGGKYIPLLVVIYQGYFYVLGYYICQNANGRFIYDVSVRKTAFPGIYSCFFFSIQTLTRNTLLVYSQLRFGTP